MIHFLPEIINRWQVAPVLVTQDIANSLGGHALFSRDRSDLERLTCPTSSHLNDFLGGELSLRMLFTSQVAKIKELRTAAIDHVSRVVRSRPVIEMGWVAACRVVAMVADAKFWGARPIFEFGRYAMGWVSDLANTESTVSVRVLGAGKRPAGIRTSGSVHRTPEPLDVVGRQASLAALPGPGAWVGAISASFQNAWGEDERLAALTARRLRGIIGVHVNLIRSCAVPRDVATIAGAFAYPHYTRNPHNQAKILPKERD